MNRQKPRVYLHCGLPKTGTTSIQLFLASKRFALRKADHDYPVVGCIGKGRPAHHNLPREIQGHPEFRPGRGTLSDVLEYVGNSADGRKVILSSEGFTNCICDAETLPKFMDFVAELQKRGDVKVVFTFRRFVHFFESSYLSKQKTGTGIGKDARPANAKRAEIWLSKFFGNLTRLRELLGPDGIIACDVDQKDSLTVFLAALGLEFRKSADSTPRKNARLGLKKAAFMHKLQYSAGKKLQYLKPKEIMQVCLSIQESSELTGEIYDYRIIKYKQANAIQAVARRLMPTFLAHSVPKIVSPESKFYEGIDLRDVVLSKEEISKLLKAVPDPMVPKLKAEMPTLWMP